MSPCQCLRKARPRKEAMESRSRDKRRSTTMFRFKAVFLGLCLSSLGGATAGLAAHTTAQKVVLPPRVEASLHPLSHLPKKPKLAVPTQSGLTSVISAKGTSSPAITQADTLATSVKSIRQSPDGSMASGPGIAGAVGSTTLILYDTTGDWGSLGSCTPWPRPTSRAISGAGPPSRSVTINRVRSRTSLRRFTSAPPTANRFRPHSSPTSTTRRSL